MNINIEKNVDLAPQTTFKIGGKADYFVQINNSDELKEAIVFAREKEIETFILAGGSNVLISDTGFRGLVIKMNIDEIEILGNKISCSAGARLSKLVKFSIENSLTGLEWAAGIPGTVGGAIRGNAGAFSGEMKDSIEEVEILDLTDEGLEIKKIKRENFNFGYRDSLVKNNKNLVILSAIFSLKKGDKKESEILAKEIIKKRIFNQPSDFSAGSFFKNPLIKDSQIIEKFEHDKEVKMRGDKLPAGWFIEDLGLKGKKIGGAQVSEKHANFIINTGKARAEDVIILSSFLKQKVRDSFGVQLEEEVMRVGF